MNDVHRVTRPARVCQVDGGPWPCSSAREAMSQAYGRDSAVLATHMSRLMAIAADDLGVDNPSRLYRRFVGWTLPTNRGCRVCGRPHHDVDPGALPRTVVWTEDHENILTPRRRSA